MLSSVISAAMAAAIAILWLRSGPKPAPGLPAGAYRTLADASHELAHRSCAAHEWVACLEGLDQTRHLDASKFGPVEQAAWKAAVAGIRQQAVVDCTKGELETCLVGLDTARRYNPEGERDPSVTLARTEVQKGLAGAAATTMPPLNPDAKVIPQRHP